MTALSQAACVVEVEIITKTDRLFVVKGITCGYNYVFWGGRGKRLGRQIQLKETKK